jgi:NAD(P)-dependent dehydrogenase (short-subunit alcohol dehydrogenase family)
MANVFITGTNSGFGWLTALALAQRGHRVIATMRETTERNAAAAAALVAATVGMPGSIDVLELDLVRAASIEAAVGEAIARLGSIDVLVNNAGLSPMGLAETFTDQQLFYQLDVGIVGPQRLLRAVLPGMRARRSGLLVHVTSQLGRVVMPMLGVHAAAKAGFEALVDAYRYELAPLGIESVIVQPGVYPTGFEDRVEVGDDHERAKDYGPLADGLERMGERYAALLSAPDAPDPEQVAYAIVGLLDLPAGGRPARLVIDGGDASDIERLNHAHAVAQREYLARMGVGEQG